MTASYTLHGGPAHGERITLPNELPFYHWAPKMKLEDLLALDPNRDVSGEMEAVVEVSVYKLVPENGLQWAHYVYVPPADAAGSGTPEHLPVPG